MVVTTNRQSSQDTPDDSRTCWIEWFKYDPAHVNVSFDVDFPVFIGDEFDLSDRRSRKTKGGTHCWIMLLIDFETLEIHSSLVYIGGYEKQWKEKLVQKTREVMGWSPDVISKFDGSQKKRMLPMFAARFVRRPKAQHIAFIAELRGGLRLHIVQLLQMKEQEKKRIPDLVSLQKNLDDICFSLNVETRKGSNGKSPLIFDSI
jgi:hypothetical protein